jgi:uncharacterized protein YdiU (UPF0061 family)
MLSTRAKPHCTMLSFQFDNAFVRELPGDPSDEMYRPRQVAGAAWSRVLPTPVSGPRVLAWSPEMARRLDLGAEEVESPLFAQVFGGNRLLDGMEPWAANYGGHQFGHWAGQLGDGRAITLGEVVTAMGERWELQLKGAGPTPYSRHADGRAVLRACVREFLCSEAMFHLGVPTTRALCLVGTGESVTRDMFYDGNPQDEPGAIVCRVSPSFLRFGNFELPAARGDTDLLARLVDFCIWRDFPHLLSEPQVEARRARWFREICERTARLMGHWMRVGFVHGVMNTDNMSVLGLTIDYGPYGWMDNFDPDWTPNTTDAESRRYRFGHQPHVAYWNLGRFAGALAPLFDAPDPLQDGLNAYVETWNRCERDNVAAKLGLAECRDEDLALMQSLHILMRDAEADMTLFFRLLGEAESAAPKLAPLSDAFYAPETLEEMSPQFRDWLDRYAARLAQDPLDEEERRERMRAANPRYVLRNYLAQEAIDRAEKGDMSGISELLDVLRRPYEDQPGRETYAWRRPAWARSRPGCSMLSCSS